jgi:hypothetical protein
VGIVEIVPERRVDPSLLTIRDNLRSRICVLLLAILVAAQVADIVTTFRALSGHLYVEDNPLLRALLVRSPLAGYSVKLLAIIAMVLLVMSRLRGRRAQFALAIAAMLSLVAPLLNFLLLVRG